ncbi:Hypothetical_protein [Hexamita inflata]|uniref:Hypothetical_protein n=1 Tax=Hexamita inflata TaxID=28002 RepID=A0ABP1GDA0_9EUKA
MSDTEKPISKPVIELVRHFVQQNLVSPCAITDIPNEVQLYFTYINAKYSWSYTKELSKLLSIDIKAIATNCLHNMGLEEEDFRNSVSVDVIDEKLIGIGCRVEQLFSAQTICDAVLSFDASYLIKKLQILRSEEVKGVSKNQSDQFKYSNRVGTEISRRVAIN